MKRMMFSPRFLGTTLMAAALFTPSPFTTLALAQTAPIASGNALISPETSEKVAKAIIASSLKKFNASMGGHGLSLEMSEPQQYTLTIPQKKPLLKEILRTLGIASEIQVDVSPITASFDFTTDALKISVEKVSTNLFRIRAHWSIDKLAAESQSLELHVPKGVFDQAFQISSRPVKIGLKKGSVPISADITLTASLKPEGTTIALESFETNIDDVSTGKIRAPQLEIQLGRLFVNGDPLTLEIISNGQSFSTTEPEIREQFQAFEPQLVKNIQKQLAKVLQKKFQGVATQLQDEKAFKIPFNTNLLLDYIPKKYENAKSLIKDIHGDFVFSYIQDLPKQKLLSTQIASRVCLEEKCLESKLQTTPITSQNLEFTVGNDISAILYESWAQNVLNSAPFQKRIREYFNKNMASPGVYLNKEGIKIHFNPKKNAIVAVVNLLIHIPSTAEKGSGLKEQLNKQLGGTIEYWFGSGALVKIPVEITASLKGVETDADGNRKLVIETSLPFKNGGLERNYLQYPSNVEEMTKKVKGEFLKSVEEKFAAAIPKTFDIPLDPIMIKGIEMNINQVLITENKGLLVSGCVK